MNEQDVSGRSGWFTDMPEAELSTGARRNIMEYARAAAAARPWLRRLVDVVWTEPMYAAGALAMTAGLVIGLMAARPQTDDLIVLDEETVFNAVYPGSVADAYYAMEEKHD
jgi:hypothetical protein